jgi:hypothetical protein
LKWNMKQEPIVSKDFFPIIVDRNKLQTVARCSVMILQEVKQLRQYNNYYIYQEGNQK